MRRKGTGEPRDGRAYRAVREDVIVECILRALVRAGFVEKTTTESRTKLVEV